MYSKCFFYLNLIMVQNHWVVQIRQQILAICLLRTTALFIKVHYIFFLLESSLIRQQNETCGTIRPPCCAKEPPTDEAS